MTLSLGTAVKKEFIESAGRPKIITSTNKRKVIKLEDSTSDYLKILIFGNSGTGKTAALAQLLDAGYKILVLGTDLGDTGHTTIKNWLRVAKNTELLKNCRVVVPENYEEVAAFLENPWKFSPELEGFDPDILAWDGFSYFQQIDLSQYVGEMSPAKDKDRGDFRESGLVLEQQDWGAIRNGTVRAGNSFLSIRKPSGAPVHKIMTCLEQITQKPLDAAKPDGLKVYIDSYKPMLQGAGGQLLLGGFDVILRAKSISKKGEDGEKRVYSYITSGNQNLVAKNRGFDLQPEEPAEMGRIWKTLLQNLGAEA